MNEKEFKDYFIKESDLLWVTFKGIKEELDGILHTLEDFQYSQKKLKGRIKELEAKNGIR